MRAVLALLLSLGLAVPALADIAVTLPSDNDEFSRLAARADAQDKTLDFHALRLAYLKSAARKRADAVEDGLRKELFTAVEADDAPRIHDAAVKLLSVDYIDMYGQKFLRQSCKILGDDACAQKAHFVEFGLLLSITQSGDGKTCKTGWDVVMVKEEYFVLAMLDTKVLSQALVDGCDLMEVTDENGQPASYYFRIGAVIEDEELMFK